MRNCRGTACRAPTTVVTGIRGMTRFGRRLFRKKTAFVCEADSFGAVLGAEFGDDVGSVEVGGFDAGTELAGDLLVGETAGEEGEHLALAGGQSFLVGEPLGK